MKQCSQNYYGNCWQNGSGHLGVSYDPATWQPVSEYSCATQVDVEEAITAARYAFEDKVGSGTFGIVHKARDKKTLELVAIKRVYQDKKYKNREL